MDAFSMVFGSQDPQEARSLLLAFVVLLATYPVFAFCLARALRNRPRGRSWCTLAANLLYVVVFLGCLELAVRWIGPPAHPLLEADAARMWRLRPHLDTESPSRVGRLITNSVGYRNRQEFAVPRPPGTLRVVCVGDSWMFGFRSGQDDTIPARLEAELAQAYPTQKVEVINAGVFGYGAAQGKATLEEALRYEPQVVVVGLLHNMNAQMSSIRADTPWQRMVKGVLQRSHLYLWLRLKLRDHIRAWEGAAAFDQALARSVHDDYSAMIDTARAHGATCIFLDYRLPPSDWPSAGKTPSAGSPPGDLYETLFAKAAQEKGCVVLPVSYHLQPDGVTMADVKEDRCHPNATGCRWMARQAASAIQQVWPAPAPSATPPAATATP